VGLSSATHDVQPQDRSGIVVPFQIRQSHSALLRLVDEKGVPLPLGSAATLRSSGVAVPVGYDGEAYVEDLGGRNELSVTEPDGKRCIARFDYQPKPGDIPVIGPIPCRRQQ
jgi:outer membrane usher protein